MLFDSVDYLFFFTLFVISYYLFPRKYRYIYLVMASYFFYACWDVRYTGILFYITVVTYFTGLRLGRKKELPIRKKNLCVSCSAVLCFGVLFIYKYYDFFCGNVERVLEKAGLIVRFPVLDIILPVGISFYIFQAFGYVVDIFRQETLPEHNFVRYAAFVSFFPNLLSGPIERSGNLLKQIQDCPKGDIDKIRKGLLQIAWGLYLKIVLSDNLAPWIDHVYGNYEGYGGIEILLATVLFGLQIYCDFAGYSFMAVGSARVLGIDLLDNFRTPYFSSSPARFWRCWHISLTSWFRDYLYIPLGGNRKGKRRKWINTMIVFLVSGLWHGASWAYVFWGGLNGFYIVAEDAYKAFREKHGRKEGSHIPDVVKGILSFALIDHAWMFFRADSLRQGWIMTRKILCQMSLERLWDGTVIREFGGRKTIFMLAVGIMILCIVDLGQYIKGDIAQWIFSRHVLIRWCIYLGLLFAIIVFGIYGYSYEQTQFIYFQF